jgi:diguanylate cyclase (GGDEF)-like protein
MSKILLLDDKKELISSLESLFASYQTQLITAKDCQSLIERAENEQPDLIILDTDLSSQEGYEVCKLLKNKRKVKNLPVLILSSEKEEADVRVQCLRVGADDCLIKPFSSKDLITRVHTIIKKWKLMQKMGEEDTERIEIRDKLSQEIEKLQQVYKGLEETAVLDKLTGLYSKTHFNSRLKEEFHRALRYETAISLVMLDIDSFERFNNSFGHDVGDYVLMKIANVLLINSRPADVVGRLDGADFAVIMPQTDAQGGVFEAERLRVAINQTEYIDDSLLDRKGEGSRRKKEDKTITASFGVASYPFEEPVKNEIEFFGWVRKALDRAKAKGKNKTVSATELL